MTFSSVEDMFSSLAEKRRFWLELRVTFETRVRDAAVMVPPGELRFDTDEAFGTAFCAVIFEHQADTRHPLEKALRKRFPVTFDEDLS